MPRTLGTGQATVLESSSLSPRSSARHPPTGRRHKTARAVALNRQHWREYSFWAGDQGSSPKDVDFPISLSRRLFQILDSS